MAKVIKKYNNGGDNIGAKAVKSGIESQILDAIKKVSSGDKKLESLLQYTAMVESSMGHDPKAFGREHTNSFMSIDDGAINRIYDILPGARGHTSTQKAWQERFKNEYGISNKEELKKRLQNDEVELSVFTARAYYAQSPSPLPETDSESLHNYWLNLYNSMGVVKNIPKDKREGELLKIQDSYITKFEDWKSKITPEEPDLLSNVPTGGKEITLKEHPEWMWKFK